QTPPAAPHAHAGAPAPLVEGLETIGLSPKLASRLRAAGGLLVTNVRPDSPAASAGLRVGDLIETVNDLPALDPRLPPAPAPSLVLGLVRDGHRMVVTVSSRQ
ncbi:MAG TPA: PDZ domain-containing protein, partial [Pyrinomonadaceae bacterium]|nr:PDZ domain-containing protein [Pyrinomonadaceae bacterium]